MTLSISDICARMGKIATTAIKSMRYDCSFLSTIYLLLDHGISSSDDPFQMMPIVWLPPSSLVSMHTIVERIGRLLQWFKERQNFDWFLWKSCCKNSPLDGHLQGITWLKNVSCNELQLYGKSITTNWLWYCTKLYHWTEINMFLCGTLISLSDDVLKSLLAVKFLTKFIGGFHYLARCYNRCSRPYLCHLEALDW